MLLWVTISGCARWDTFGDGVRRKIETLWGNLGARKFVKHCPKGRKYNEIFSLQSADENMWLLEKVCKSGVEKST